MNMLWVNINWSVVTAGLLKNKDVPKTIMKWAELLSKYLNFRTNQKQPTEYSVKKGVLKNFAKFIRTRLCQSLIFNKVAGLWKETLAQVFSCEFCKIFKYTFFAEHLLKTASTNEARLMYAKQRNYC